MWTKVCVPEETVLGLFLFLPYSNDFPDHISFQDRLFADDCLIYYSITSDSSHNELQQDLKKPRSLGPFMGDDIQCQKMLHHDNIQENAICIFLHALWAHTRKS